MCIRPELSTEATAALNTVLLQAAIRAERVSAERSSDQRARDLARRMDEKARAA